MLVTEQYGYVESQTIKYEPLNFYCLLAPIFLFTKATGPFLAPDIEETP
jgi:hypothetical protein